MKLSARNLCWTAGGSRILHDVSLEARTGEFVGIVGPNGSGKTSLMALLSGIRQPKSGEVLLDGAPLRSLARREMARRVALVEQQAGTTERITARQAVELGRTPHLRAFSAWSERDDAVVEAAMEKVGTQHLAHRVWQSLSGGERQRLHIARALAQQPEVLLLDEPTNHLDIAHQIGLLDLVRRQGLTVVASLHDLNHAAMFCNRLVVIHHGQVVVSGSPQEVLTGECVRAVFGVDVDVEREIGGRCLLRYRLPGELRHDPSKVAKAV